MPTVDSVLASELIGYLANIDILPLAYFVELLIIYQHVY